MTIRNVLFHLMIVGTIASAQSLFDDTGTENWLLNNKYYYLSGSLQGYGQYLNNNPDPFSHYYAAGSFQLNTLNTAWTNAYADLRIRYGRQGLDLLSQLDLREAYVDLYYGNFDLRLGKQIVSWGKADGLNPTDNITPMDFTYRSPYQDDRRMGNYIARIKYHFSEDLGAEAIWIPLYEASILPLEVIPLPENVTYGGQISPSNDLINSSYAAKFFYDGAAWDASLSYFNGFETNAGFALGDIHYASSGIPLVTFETRTFRKQVYGADFSMGLGEYGLRAEMAYSRPEDGFHENSWVANPSFNLVVGMDRSFGSFHLNAEYSMKHVFDFQELHPPQDPRMQIGYDLEYYNRLFNGQFYAWSHVLMLRPSMSFFYDSMNAELVTQYNFTSGELTLMPKVSYKVNDLVSLNLGANYYLGGNNTLYNLIGSSYNGPYAGISFSF